MELSEHQRNLVNKTKDFIKNTLENAEGGHDWWHILRVWQNARIIAAEENANLFIVEMGALLHDIADSKFHGGDEEIGPRKAAEYLNTLLIPSKSTGEIINIVRYVSFKGGHENNIYDSIELQIVKDADRLDAIGAIGIARAFNYGGFKNRTLYDPFTNPNLQMTKEKYKKSEAPTINHFYEKLLLLKDLMHTRKGKEMAEKRHDFMLKYLEQFYRE